MAKQWARADAARDGRRLIHTAREASLGTLGESGSPHVSHVSCATLTDGAPIVLISDLALHTRNVKRDSRASLLFVAPSLAGEDTNARGRITLDGTLAPAPDRAVARSRFLRRQPDAAGYIDFTDFQLMRLEVTSAYIVAGFGRITSLDPADVLAPAGAAAEFAALDEGACVHMDEDHADALALYAKHFAGAADGAWRAVGVDPLGIDLATDSDAVRVEFPEPLSGAGSLRVALKKLADEARSKH